MERQYAVSVTRARNQLVLHQQGLQSLLGEKSSLFNRWLKIKGRRVESMEIRQMMAQRVGLDDSIREQRLLVEEAQGHLEEARQRWTEAKKDKRILEIVKERAFREFLNRLNRLELQQLDEASLRSTILRIQRLRGEMEPDER
jgi:flagellar export protein FliJ